MNRNDNAGMLLTQTLAAVVVAVVVGLVDT